MRAFVITAPGRYEVTEVEPPHAAAGQVVVDVERAGVCGTDVEVLSGHMAYLESGEAQYPMRIGHEWCGRISAVGAGVDPAWIGRRVTADTMLGCGDCARCRAGRHNICAERFEIGLRGGWPGAVAEQVGAPAGAVHVLPDTIDPACGAMIEPGGNAWRAVDASGLVGGDRLLIIGSGTIGLLAALFAKAQGIEVHVLGIDRRTLDLAVNLGADGAWTTADLPSLGFGAAIDASTSAASAGVAVEAVEPGGRVVLVGVAAEPSTVDSRRLVMKDLHAVGLLAGSFGLAGAIRAYATGAVDPRPLIAATVSLGETGAILEGRRPPGAGAGPKVHIDPRR